MSSVFLPDQTFTLIKDEDFEITSRYHLFLCGPGRERKEVCLLHWPMDPQSILVDAFDIGSYDHRHALFGTILAILLPLPTSALEEMARDLVIDKLLFLVEPALSEILTQRHEVTSKLVHDSVFGERISIERLANMDERSVDILAISWRLAFYLAASSDRLDEELSAIDEAIAKYSVDKLRFSLKITEWLRRGVKGFSREEIDELNGQMCEPLQKIEPYPPRPNRQQREILQKIVDHNPVLSRFHPLELPNAAFFYLAKMLRRANFEALFGFCAGEAEDYIFERERLHSPYFIAADDDHSEYFEVADDMSVWGRSPRGCIVHPFLQDFLFERLKTKSIEPLSVAEKQLLEYMGMRE